MPHHLPLERAFVRDGPAAIGLVALGILLRLAFGRSTDESFAAEQVHRMLRREGPTGSPAFRQRPEMFS